MSILASASAASAATDQQDRWYVRVTDLKQFAYCPRVPYYMYCLPNLRPTTYKMQAGIEAQEQVTELEERRSLRAYGLSSGERHFHIAVRSEVMGCVGQVDMVIESQEGGIHRLIPVDYKFSRRTPGHHFQLQVVCYGMMLEEMYGLPVAEGFIYLIQSREVERVMLTKRLRREAAQSIAVIRRMMQTQQVPPPTSQSAQCVACEYRRFCNDVL